MSKVYVIQQTRRPADVSPAATYGDIHFVLTAGDRTSVNPDQTLRRLDKQLANFTADDYILWAGGDPLSLILVGAVLFDLGHDSFRYLRYEKADPRNPSSVPYYVPVEVTLAEPETRS